MTIFVGVFFFYLGGALGFFVRSWLEKKKTYDGVIVITATPEKTLFSIELADDPELMIFEKDVLLRVDVTEKRNDRE